MVQYHNYSTSEIENMIVYERDIYLAMIKDKIDKQNQV